jgi:zinc protease
MVVTSAPSFPQNDDRATSILNRYVQAIGGKSNLERIHTRVTQSTMSLSGGVTANLETLQQYPDRFITHSQVTVLGGIPVPGLGFSSGYDGTIGWESVPKEGFHTVENDRLQQHVLASRLDREARLNEIYPGRKLLPDAIIDGKPQHVIELSTTFGTREVWFFDAASGLLTRTETQGLDDKKSPIKVTNTFGEYREVDGVQLPFHTDVQEGADKYTIVVKSVTHNVPIDPRRFVPPNHSDDKDASRRIGGTARP